MNRTMKFVGLVMVALLFVGCTGGSGSNSAIDAALRSFEKATNVIDENGEYNAAKARENILKLSYNEPSNPFWTLGMWYQTERYIFKDWVLSVDGNKADIILTYSTINSVDGSERPNYTKTFTMQNFSGVWRVNLAEFVGVD